MGITMASGTKQTGDDHYDTALRRLMQTCLPPILVEIVDKRPPDPINHLALALYKYRERQDAVMNSLSSDARNMQGHSSAKQKHSTRSGSNSDSKRKAVNTSHVRIVQDKLRDEGLSDITEEIDDLVVSDQLLHKTEETVMAAIGDIFDDGDIS